MAEHLFNLKAGESFSEKIKSLSTSNLQETAGRTIADRGQDYFENDAVDEDIDISMGEIELSVSGSYGDYTVLIQQKKDVIRGKCDCPYDDGVCKHMVASLLYLQKNVPLKTLEKADITAKAVEAVKDKKNSFVDYINSLKISELRALVLKFAPEIYREEIAIKILKKEGGAEEIKKEFNKVKKEFERIFNGELYNVDDFEKKEDKICAKLQPFWTVFPKETTNVICKFMKSVEAAIEENYLCDEYDDVGYEGGDFGYYIAEFIIALPNEARKAALLKIYKTKNGLGYGLFETLELAIIQNMPMNEWEAFKDVIIEIDWLRFLSPNEVFDVYEKIQAYLSSSEKETFLKERHLNNTYLNVAFFQLYESNNEPKKAYNVLAAFLNQEKRSSNFYYSSENTLGHQQYQAVIRLSAAHYPADTESWVEKYIANIPSMQTFVVALEYRPDKRLSFESFFKEKQPHLFVEILEAENRLAEIVDYFETDTEKFKFGDTIFSFYKRHKKQFPQEAAKVFYEKLDVAIVNTGNSNYSQVAECLKELKPITPQAKFSILVTSIKNDYYRRRNLIQLLEKEGLFK